MRLIPFRKLDELSAFIGRSLEQVGAAPPEVDIRITGAATKKLERSGNSRYEPGASVNVPIVEGAADAEISVRAELIREFARNGTALFLVEISRPGRLQESGQAKIDR